MRERRTDKLAGTLLTGTRHFHDLDGVALNHHLGVSGLQPVHGGGARVPVRIDPSISLDIAALFGCAVLTGAGAVFNTARVEPGSGVAVFGLGGVGLSVVMGARAAGAYPIIAVDLLNNKLALAREVGASHTVNAREADPVEAVKEITAAAHTTPSRVWATSAC